MPADDNQGTIGRMKEPPDQWKLPVEILTFSEPGQCWQKWPARPQAGWAGVLAEP